MCRGCGAPTQARTGKGDAYEYCKACNPGAAAPKLTREAVRQAMRLWRSRYGAAPSPYDWSRTHARKRGGDALTRLNEADWPPPATVIDLYGTWAERDAKAARSARRRGRRRRAVCRRMARTRGGKPKLARAGDLSRAMLVDFLDHIAQLPLATNTRRGMLRGINIVLEDVDRHGWARLQHDARYYPGELPAQSETVPRFIDETVMRQLETDQALARLRDETTITAVIVLIETGLRSNDALQLPADPVVVLPDGSPVLRFVSHKRNREAAIPISDRLLERIRRQHAHNARAFPNGSPWLPE